MDDKRQYELPFGELIDKLTITQLRETLLNSDQYTEEILQLEHDINLVLDRHASRFVSARFLRLVFLMGQLNTLIWMFKDKMAGADEETYVKYLKLSHQVNGLKNIVKNKLMKEMGEPSASLKTNTWVDSLEYKISI